MPGTVLSAENIETIKDVIQGCTVWGKGDKMNYTVYCVQGCDGRALRRDTEPSSGRDTKKGFREEGVAGAELGGSEAAGKGGRSSLTENAEERSVFLATGVRT